MLITHIQCKFGMCKKKVSLYVYRVVLPCL